MNFNLSDPNRILNALPDPLILLRDGLVVYHNPAAALLLPGLEIGKECPQPLAAALPLERTDGASACVIGKYTYTVSISITPEADVVVLRPMLRHIGASACWIPLFTKQVREQLTGLLAAVHQLEADLLEEGDERHDKWLAILNQNAYRLLRVAGMAELRHRLTHGEAYHPGALDLAGLCRGLEGEVAPLTRQMGLAFHYDSSVDSLITTGDSVLLRRMLLGLISNAMKAVHQGGSLGLRLNHRKNRALLTVWDDGPGMDERSLGSLFQEEWSGMIPRPGEGLQLSLFNARSIADLHGGVLVVESKQGDGARFTVSLPVSAPKQLSLRTPRSVVDDSGGFSSLLVELSDALPWQAFLPSELE